tara:strand:- start:24957 stop:25652 length:696 start_codon:yes stop_codon:yes gene_type:complete
VSFNAEILQPDFEKVNELKARFLKDGEPVVASADDLLSYGYTNVRALFQEAAVYVWPTTELIAWLKNNLPELDSTIEIGSGNGVIAQELGVTATDSYMQSDRFEPKSKEQEELHKSGLMYYDALRQQRIKYGSNVEQLDAIDAVLKYKPKHILGCYITHKFKEGMSQGNALGVNEEWILNRRHFQSYTMVGNLSVHGSKPILSKKHEQIKLDGLLLRAKLPEENRIFVWRK